MHSSFLAGCCTRFPSNIKKSTFVLLLGGKFFLSRSDQRKIAPHIVGGERMYEVHFIPEG